MTGPMVQLTYDGLKTLHDHAAHNGTLDRWAVVALTWAAAADAHIKAADAAAETLARDRDTLSTFAKWAVDHVREGLGVDSTDLQEKATALGLIVATPMSEPCGDRCVCAEIEGEFPLLCYRDSPLLELIVPPPPRPLPPPRAYPRDYRASAILTAAPTPTTPEQVP